MQSSFEVVLVEPADSLNIGAVLRAMSNLGFSRITLVAPRKFRPKKAAVAACWAAPLLKDIKIVDSLREALLDKTHAVAFSARDGKNRPTRELMGTWAAAQCSKGMQQTALVFGPEDSGLRLEQLELCTQIVRIPSAAGNPSYNLAQAVLLVLFEIYRCSANSSELLRESAMPDLSSHYALDQMLETLLQQSGFYHNETPEDLPVLVKQMFRRIEPNEREMRILLGIFGTIRKKLEGE